MYDAIRISDLPLLLPAVIFISVIA